MHQSTVAAHTADGASHQRHQVLMLLLLLLVLLLVALPGRTPPRGRQLPPLFPTAVQPPLPLLLAAPPPLTCLSRWM
jgi:hypothetical protein